MRKLLWICAMFCVGGFAGQFMTTTTTLELGTIAAFLLPLAIGSELVAILIRDRCRKRQIDQIASEGPERCANTAAFAARTSPN